MSSIRFFRLLIGQGGSELTQMSDPGAFGRRRFCASARGRTVPKAPRPLTICLRSFRVSSGRFAIAGITRERRGAEASLVENVRSLALWRPLGKPLAFNAIAGIRPALRDMTMLAGLASEISDQAAGNCFFAADDFGHGPFYQINLIGTEVTSPGATVAPSRATDVPVPPDRRGTPH
jgi:hypothetical protein